MNTACDVVVVGGGSAAICAALAAREQGKHVILLERAPQHERGGNTAFTGGALRMVYDGVDDLLQLVPDLTEEEIANTDFGSYTREDFLGDIGRVTQYRTDADLSEIMVNRSFETYKWLKDNYPIRFGLMFKRQSFEVNGRRKFYGGLAVEAWGGGPEYSAALFRAVEDADVDVRYNARASALLSEGRTITGVVVTSPDATYEIAAKAVVLAAGGFSSNAAWRAQYLGTGWELASVRGTRHNMGDGIRLALENDAMPFGQWSHCHAVGQDMNAPVFGEHEMGDSYQKHSYPYGIMVNADGQRFVDEGADFRNFTYARYGKRILEQPNHVAWQVFDQKAMPYLREEYRIKRVTKVTGDTLEELAQRMDGVDVDGFLATVEEYNNAVDDSTTFDPTIRDGKATQGLAISKSNWANRIDEGPFEAYGVSPGVTFTFGGVKISNDAEVISVGGDPVPGLFAAGEMVGGIFYYNYPAGTGLTSGAVFGKIAGTSAAKFA